MRRISITMENYDDSKIVRSFILQRDEESSAAISLLGRAGIEFSVEEVDGDLYDLQLDDGDRYIDLSLRTKMEIEQWINRGSFESTVKCFLESREVSIRVSLGHNDTYVKIDRSYLDIIG